MALSKTTNSAAISASDKSILLASIAGLTLGQTIKIDDEKMRVTSVPSAATLPVGVFRGIEGTAVVAHATGANVVFGDGPDFTGSSYGSQLDPARRRRVQSYSATGAIALPDPGSDLVAIINGAAALAMTLAVPSKANDGDMLTVVSNGKINHTVTLTGGAGGVGATADVFTFVNGQSNAVMFVAANETWQLVGAVAGAATIAGPGIG